MMTEPEGVTYCADGSYRLIEGDRCEILPAGTTPAELTTAANAFFTHLRQSRSIGSRLARLGRRLWPFGKDL